MSPLEPAADQSGPVVFEHSLAVVLERPVRKNQLLFLFDQDTTVEKTLIQTLDCQLSCNSCSRLTRT